MFANFGLHDLIVPAKFYAGNGRSKRSEEPAQQQPRVAFEILFIGSCEIHLEDRDSGDMHREDRGESIGMRR